MRKPRPSPWLPTDYEAGDIYALQAVFKGEADASQQRRALEWIIHRAAETYDEPFRSNADGGDRDTAFALGKRFVGSQIVKLINMPPKVAAQLRSKDGG